jgi:chemotaxis protein histidine kinase CheA
MKEVLTQLVRNSVYHGIEAPEKRVGLSKNETGKITLSVKVENGAVHIVLGDDGGGLDYKRIAQIAKEKGLLRKDADTRDELLLSNIIFSPGFSTSETENIHAGRGIGLNLVKDRLREAGGSMRLKSIKGRGLIFDIQIPLN